MAEEMNRQSTSSRRREQMVGCHHERGTDFRPSEIGKRIAD